MLFLALILLIPFHYLCEEDIRSTQQPNRIRQFKQCTSKFVNYHPSKYESDWVDNIVTRQESVCYHLLKEISQQNIWFTGSQGYHENHKINLTDPSFREVFSCFEYIRKCKVGGGTGSSKSEPVYELIEPLAGHLRDHRTLCGMHKINIPNFPVSKTGSGIDKRHILLGGSKTLPTIFFNNEGGSGNGAASSATTQLSKRMIRRQPTILIMDIGAGQSYLDSQKWFVDQYINKGFKLGRIVMWEAGPHSPSSIFSDVPTDVISNYQFFNMPVTSDFTSNMHPWKVLSELAPLYNYVALKLDIDYPSLENELIKQLTDDPLLLSSIDEMFFEHHINNNETLKFWENSKNGVDGSKTLSDSFDLFTRLRKYGIRIHGWP